MSDNNKQKPAETSSKSSAIHADNEPCPYGNICKFDRDDPSLADDIQATLADDTDKGEYITVDGQKIYVQDLLGPLYRVGLTIRGV